MWSYVVNGTRIGGVGLRIRPVEASSIEMKGVMLVRGREEGGEASKERDEEVAEQGGNGGLEHKQRAVGNKAQPSLDAAIHSQSRGLTTVDIC